MRTMANAVLRLGQYGRDGWTKALGLILSLSLGASILFGPVKAADQPAQKVFVYGHRGGRKWAPENTLSSFRQCVENGYGIELDIHKCKSGELVVMHDEDVSRCTNGAGLIKDKTLTELRELDAGKWYAPNFANEKIPLLSEVFDLVKGKVPIYIEIKNAPVFYPGIEDDLLTLLKKYNHDDMVTIISFDHKVIHRIHKKAPQYRLGFLGCDVPYDVGAYAHGLGAKAWHADFEGIRPSDVEDAHKSSVAVSVWTVNKPEDWDKAVKMGVDTIVTDDPAGLAAHLKH